MRRKALFYPDNTKKTNFSIHGKHLCTERNVYAVNTAAEGEVKFVILLT